MTDQDKELSKEDKERIGIAAYKLIPTFTSYGRFSAEIGSSERSYAESEFRAFLRGAKYEHPIAFNQGKIEGFNEGIEAAKELLWKERFSSKHCVASLVEELEKLKK